MSAIDSLIGGTTKPGNAGTIPSSKTTSAIDKLFEQKTSPTPVPSVQPSEPSKKKTIWQKAGGAIDRIFNKPPQYEKALVPTKLSKEAQERVDTNLQKAIEKAGAEQETIKSMVRQDSPLYRHGPTAVFAQTFAPTKFISAGRGQGVAQAEAELAAQYQQEHPYLSIIPSIAGTLANLILLRQAGAAVAPEAAATRAVGGIKTMFPTLARAIPMSVGAGTLFGLNSLINEGLKQATERKAQPSGLLGETIKGTGFGLVTGPAGAMATLPGRVAAGSGLMGGATGLERLIENGTITRDDLKDIVVNGIIGGFFELAGGTTKTRLFREEVARDVSISRDVAKIRSGDPKITESEALRQVQSLNRVSWVSRVMDDIQRKYMAENNGKPMPGDMYRQIMLEVNNQATHIGDDIIGRLDERVKTEIRQELERKNSELLKQIDDLIAESKTRTPSFEGVVEKPVETTPAVKTSAIDALTSGAPVKPSQVSETPQGEVVAPETDETTSPTESLLSEARKYKTAEEFVRAQRPEPVIDSAGRNVVGEKNGIKIVVDSAENPKFITLWDGEKRVGYLRTSNKAIGEPGYLQVGNVEVNPKYRNMGLATEMYKTLEKYAPEGSKGIVGYGPDIIATKKIPSIYKKLGGQLDEATGNLKVDFTDKTKSQLTSLWEQANKVPPELKRNWYRGVRQENQGGDMFASAAKDVAGDYGAVRKLKPDELPKNPLIVDSKEDLIDKVGYKHETPLAEKISVPISEKFDTLAREYATRNGYDGIFYLDGTLNEPELVIFREQAQKETETRPTPTQKEVVVKAVAEKPKSIKEVATETGIKEPNIRRIRGVKEKPIKLLSPVMAASKIVTKNASLPILKNFNVDGGELTATDLSVGIRLKTTLPDGVYQIIGKEPIKTNLESADFPVVPKEEGEHAFTISTANLSRVLKDTALTVSKSDTRPELTGTYFAISNGKLIVASTDGFRLTMATVPAKVVGTGEFIIRDPKKVQAVVESLGDTVTVSVGEKNIILRGSEGEIIVNKLDGVYPRFVQIIPSYTSEYSFDREEMVAALAEIKPFLDSIRQADIVLKDDRIILSAENKALGAKKEVSVPTRFKEVKTLGASVHNGVLVMPLRERISNEKGADANHVYLSEAIKTLQEDRAYLYFDKDFSPLFFTDKEHTDTVVIAPETSEGKAKKKRAPSGMAAVGAASIGTFEEVAPQPTESDMKLYDEVRNLIKKYAQSIGEGYTSPRSLGTYYPKTKNIRIKGMNDVSVATHEITHFLDFAFNITDQVQGIKGYSVIGSPIYLSDTAKYRKEMTDLYEQYYPGAKRKHKLQKRMHEGFATLLQKYVEQPSTITAQFPNLVRDFLQEGGKFYKPVMGEIIADLRAMIARYQGLPALDKIGTRVVTDKVDVKKDDFLTFWDKFKTEVTDNVYPIEKLARMGGVHFTEADPSLWVRQYGNSSGIILNNINGDRGYWGWRDGRLVKLHDFNWKTLIKELHDAVLTDQFGYWLVARREYFAFQEIAKLKEEYDQQVQSVNEAGGAGEAAKLVNEDGGSMLDAMKATKVAYEEAEQILAKDGFTEKEVTEAYLENKDLFDEYAKKYDALVHEDLVFIYENGLVSPEEFNKLTSKEGYASFKRYFYDELVGEEAHVISRRSGGTKVSSMLRRTGSQKPIIHPLASALTNHAEATRKGLKQIVYNRMGRIAKQFPGLFQELALKAIPDAQGRMIFPQEKDPKIIMARVAGKRVPYLVDATIKRTLDEVLNPQNISTFEQVMMGASRFFTKGTTGLFPGFAITNYTVDQMTAAAQTRNNYIPLYDPFTRLFAMLDPSRSDHKYLQEYMVLGGERQTIVGWQDLAPNELFALIGKERAGILRAIDAINAGMDILAIPSKWSEIMTRATEYIKAREAGKDELVAFEEAGRVTAPFHHIGRFGGGRFGQTWVRSIPFFNPGIQVLAQAAETMGSEDGRMRYLFVALAVIAANITGLGMIMAFGTEEQKQEYADKHPDELNKYIWYPLPGGKGLGKIRVPDQMNFIGTLVNMVWADNKLQANYNASEYLNAIMAWLPAQADISQPSKMFLSYVPQMIKPGILTILGKKDFPKIMPLESQALTSKEPGYRFTASTSPVAKWLGKTFGLSPIKIDYLLTGYVGRASGFLTGKPRIYNPLTQLSSSYYFESGRRVQMYYDAKRINDEQYNSLLHGVRKFTKEQAIEVLAERQKLKLIDTALSQYRDVDEEAEPKRARKYRDYILQLIGKL